MQPPTIFNPRPRIDRVPLDNGGHCFVIDDVLLDADGLARWLAEQRQAFRPVDFNAYPGIYLLPPSVIGQAVQEFFNQHLRGLFDARRLVHMESRFAMVTLPASALRPYQWLCHSDNFNLPPGVSIQASVLYLFRDEGLGGTSFYEPAVDADTIARLFADASSMPAAAFSARHGMEPGYMVGSNRWFRQVGSVPARFNRLVVYDGALLHTGDILAPERLSDDPATGRLTFNGFFSCRRNAA